MKVKRPVLLAILDGWGISEPDKGNAVDNANMVFVEYLKKTYPWLKAHASGKWVGLPDNQMGNSEVGHIHLGAGRINLESLAKLNHETKTNNIAKNEEIVKSFEYVKNNNSALHLMGLFSNGGVHSHFDHMIAIYKAAIDYGITNIKFDLITDGRDTKPKLAYDFVKDLLELIKQNNNIGVISSISGRYYAMDRDKRFDRSRIAYNAITNRNNVRSFTNILDYIQQEYMINHDDEMIIPAFNQDDLNGNLKANDAIIMTNFRPDRAIQISSILTNKNYIAWQSEAFSDAEFIGDKIRFVSMMKYSDSITSPHIAYPPKPLTNTLGQYLSKLGLKQLRIAETEKIAHVTFFFDGGNDYFKNGLAKNDEITLANAYIDLIPSAKVATYDLKPQMSAVEITDKLLEEIKKDEFDFIVLNFANCDMVGHTGNNKATEIACKTLDEQLKRIHEEFVLRHNGIMIITADHGNAEIMIDKDGQVNKKHTTSLVPIIITDLNIKLKQNDPAIAKVAPTILDLMNIEIPKEMELESMIDHN
ncbi:2,3-bisphosphoglycerate-independent phosphoglycerate mutase [Mycoplasma mycoides]|uniref:2,3-bisphosphoglycerate-independent phosphoglycerate mutase n=1 Tax=Mycoplasma mycoides subsp. capri TaxID=40477 RepID=A0AB38GID6_MYCMC|nr:2,3-bisphosphoglycerate-independent phosphoglycerate mutase [Mycoplasma mycoides]ADH21981.1 2,3-bisphosphoglycerate-independent phosphoglycerate mutase [synthetic Mycoplasma mycoides JCVI-syn1.0]AMW76643.1 pgm_bpd_ind: phosphoglycerate mutase (2,3-diphosphoglycerate-independent) [synthetic bacterium JCVI-Syn3.0]AMW77116.1 pgm_bpd_ind: phosphoglycerate mutase (2,3-diphosphoglycerate-independent) [synthetic bacterium JCVI-Syn2.0]AVX54943.1 Phosphoglycerate mutase (2,3-diphosphoglycerate-indepe